MVIVETTTADPISSRRTAPIRAPIVMPSTAGMVPPTLSSASIFGDPWAFMITTDQSPLRAVQFRVPVPEATQND